MLSELLDVYDNLKGNKDTLQIFYTLLNMAQSSEEKLALISELKLRIIRIKEEEKIGDFQQPISAIVDLIEGRNMEKISTRLAETVEEVNENVSQHEQKLSAIDENLSKQDKKIKEIREK